METPLVTIDRDKKSLKHQLIDTKTVSINNILNNDIGEGAKSVISSYSKERNRVVDYPTKFLSVAIATKEELIEFQEPDNKYDNMVAIDNNISGNEYDNIEAIAEAEVANEYDNILAINVNDPDHIVAIPPEKVNDPDYLPALPSDTNETNVTKPKPQSYGIYVVKQGDTLSVIAKKFMVKTDKLSQINKLGEKQIVWIGQRLKIIGTQEHIDNINEARYVVKKGDSLIMISKVYDIDIKLLKKHNKLPKGLLLRVGQKLMLPLPHKLAQIKEAEEKERLRKLEIEKKAKIALLKKQRAAAKKAKIALLKKKKVAAKRKAAKETKKSRSKKRKGKFKRKLRVTATAYVSVKSQTDSTPFMAAWKNRIRPGMKIIAVSNDLIREFGITNGSRVKISGLSGIYTVRDKMNRKWRRKIDIYMGLNNRRAMRWGKRRVILYY